MLPQMVTFSGVKPAGFATDYKKYVINPQMNFNQLKTDHTIKFYMNTDGFVDPYSVFFRVRVEVDPDKLGTGALILDSPTSTCLI